MDITPTCNKTVMLEWEIDNVFFLLEIGKTRMSGIIQREGHADQLLNGQQEVLDALLKWRG